MQQAPSVVYPLGDARALRQFALTGWLLVALADLGWLVMSDLHDWQVWLGLGLTLGAGLVAWQLRPRDSDGSLLWDGGGWYRRSGGREFGGRATVHLDLQSSVLVYWMPAGGSGAWCWLHSSADPSRWLALRRALHAPESAAKVVAGASRPFDATGKA